MGDQIRRQKKRVRRRGREICNDWEIRHEERERENQKKKLRWARRNMESDGEMERGSERLR